jgi:hypothetical protein
MIIYMSISDTLATTDNEVQMFEDVTLSVNLLSQLFEG